jgi:hypothetical protein
LMSLMGLRVLMDLMGLKISMSLMGLRMSMNLMVSRILRIISMVPYPNYPRLLQTW